MKQLLLILSFICSVGITVCCGQQDAVIPSSFLAGDASVAYSIDWIPLHTPASLANQTKGGVQLMYENRYITKELANKTINAWWATKYFNIGAVFTHFGYSSYNEMLAALTIARPLGKYVRLGVEVDYYTLYYASLNRYKGTVTAQIGLQVDATKHLTLAANVFNPTFSKIRSVADDNGYRESAFDKYVPVVFQLGFCYNFYQLFYWHVQFEKEVRSPFQWATGVEYRPSVVPGFVVRLGAFGSNYIQPTLGAGFETHGLAFDVSANYHTYLGFSLMCALRYSFATIK